MQPNAPSFPLLRTWARSLQPALFARDVSGGQRGGIFSADPDADRREAPGRALRGSALRSHRPGCGAGCRQWGAHPGGPGADRPVSSSSCSSSKHRAPRSVIAPTLPLRSVQTLSPACTFFGSVQAGHGGFRNEVDALALIYTRI